MKRLFFFASFFFALFIGANSAHAANKCLYYCADPSQLVDLTNITRYSAISYRFSSICSNDGQCSPCQNERDCSQSTTGRVCATSEQMTAYRGQICAPTSPNRNAGICPMDSGGRQRERSCLDENLVEAPARDVEGELRSPVGGIPGEIPPQPAHPGDRFRCQFVCKPPRTAEVQNGSVCSGSMIEIRTCLDDCARVCGSPELCETTGRMAPQCVPVAAPQATSTVAEASIEQLQDPFAGRTFQQLIGSVVKVALGFIGSIFFTLLIWAGVKWMTAQGDKKAVEEAQSTVKHAVVGVAIVVLAYAIVNAFLQIVTTLSGPAA